jgi:hypothetical protein
LRAGVALADVALGYKLVIEVAGRSGSVFSSVTVRRIISPLQLAKSASLRRQDGEWQR